MSNVIA